MGTWQDKVAQHERRAAAHAPLAGTKLGCPQCGTPNACACAPFPALTPRPPPELAPLVAADLARVEAIAAAMDAATQPAPGKLYPSFDARAFVRAVRPAPSVPAIDPAGPALRLVRTQEEIAAEEYARASWRNPWRAP